MKKSFTRKQLENINYTEEFKLKNSVRKKYKKTLFISIGIIVVSAGITTAVVIGFKEAKKIA